MRKSAYWRYSSNWESRVQFKFAVRTCPFQAMLEGLARRAREKSFEDAPERTLTLTESTCFKQSVRVYGLVAFRFKKLLDS